MRSQTSLLYTKLQDWIDYTFQVENDAVNEMDILFRSFIEQECQIQNEIQLNYVDVVISHKTLNFLTPSVKHHTHLFISMSYPILIYKPVILPAKESIFPNKFTIS